VGGVLVRVWFWCGFLVRVLMVVWDGECIWCDAVIFVVCCCLVAAGLWLVGVWLLGGVWGSCCFEVLWGWLVGCGFFVVGGRFLVFWVWG